MGRNCFFLPFLLFWTCIQVQQYPFVHYPPREGLANNRAKFVFQDSGEYNRNTEEFTILKVPNVVGKNQTWLIPGIEGTNNEVLIVNSMGQLVFRSANYRNNISIGDTAPGIYFYRIRIVDKDGSVKYYTGQLRLRGNME